MTETEPEIVRIQREIWALDDELAIYRLPLHERRLLQAEIATLRKRRDELTGQDDASL